jgi:hypothetical protein
MLAKWNGCVGKVDVLNNTKAVLIMHLDWELEEVSKK